MAAQRRGFVSRVQPGARGEGVFIFGPHPRADYGQAIIPQAYVERVWSRLLDIRAFRDDVFGQAVIVATRL